LTLSPSDALCFLAESMDLWLKTWDESAGFADVRAAWLERAGPVGEPLSVHGPEGAVAGRFAGLDDDGALRIVLAEGGERRFTYGDVTLPGASDTEGGKDDDSR
jgi:BirA family biotin operon repressor/biotin-[acetyl-CoA-carboxylase] ligase